MRLPVVRAHAPAFPSDFTWLNTDRPLDLRGNLAGHVLVLDFWTYCCINCMHVLPDLEYLEHKYADQPVMVIGVHSAKFDAEALPRNIQQAIARYRITHPVIVDQDHRIWSEYGVRAWPTFAIVDSRGRHVGNLSGEGKRQTLDTIVQMLLDEGRADGTLAESPLRISVENQIPGMEGLAFPGKITADPQTKRLFIADSNHDRIVVTDRHGVVLEVIGSGERGFADGSFEQARFFNPQGLAVDGDIVYVADTDNHAIRRIDLAAKRVTTIAGNGRQSYDRVGGGEGREQGLSSPWDVAVNGGRLYIAMAGTHQIWIHHLDNAVSRAWVGTGGEDIVDGPMSRALLAQPSGLAILDGWLYFADSEVSAVRRASLLDGAVETLIGTGLFDFGHKDGAFDQALLQHCLGVAVLGDGILVADTYNNALRLIDLKSRTISTLLSGEDRLDEPGGVTVLEGVVYIADTNNHRIIRYDPPNRRSQPLTIRIER